MPTSPVAGALNPAEFGLSDDPWGVAINDWLWRDGVTKGEPPIDLIDPESQTGPGRIVRGNLMPATLLELLYVTHEGDARILRDPEAREVIARAIADGILEVPGHRVALDRSANASAATRYL